MFLQPVTWKQQGPRSTLVTALKIDDIPTAVKHAINNNGGLLNKQEDQPNKE
jgi:hypothetical protein